MKVAIITGASSGMGREFAIQISKKYRTIKEIWIIARRKERLEDLASFIENKRVRIIPLDLEQEKSIIAYKNLLKKYNPNVKVLVNSAGYGKIGNFTDLSLNDNVGMIKLNDLALTQITYLTIPYMKRKSKIINLASSAGFLPQPRFAIYAATKSFVVSFSRALNRELKPKGITVTAVCPGPVKTEFFDLAEKTGEVKIYKKFIMANPKLVVKKAIVDTRRKKDMSVYGIAINGFRMIAKFLPHKILIKFIK